MYIKRKIEEEIIDYIKNRDKIIVIYGARQVGKTTLIDRILEKIELKSFKINAEELIYNSIFSKRDLSAMLEVVEGYDILFIDEAQTIENIGINIKILHDAKPDLKIILTGSSSFDLSNRIKESLTGRTKSYMLYPLGFSELGSIYNKFELKRLLNDYLILGGYPELYNYENRIEKVSHLRELSSSYLYKDVLEFSRLKYSKKLFDLLRLLAYQIGSTVSIHEISNKLKVSSETVERYIDLLEKSFIIFRLSGFSRNLRKEISKKDKIFFYDLGIRNAIINNFASIENRIDYGQLWENFLISERMKYNDYNQKFKQTYFWRTYTGAEIDYIEEYDGKLYGFEFKWGKKIPKVPKTWRQTYKNSSFSYINKDNFLKFIM